MGVPDLANYGAGGGIANFGRLTIEKQHHLGEHGQWDVQPTRGGNPERRVRVDSAPLTITNSTISGNAAGAKYGYGLGAA